MWTNIVMSACYGVGYVCGTAIVAYCAIRVTACGGRRRMSFDWLSADFMAGYLGGCFVSLIFTYIIHNGKKAAARRLAAASHAALMDHFHVRASCGVIEAGGFCEVCADGYCPLYHVVLIGDREEYRGPRTCATSAGGKL